MSSLKTVLLGSLSLVASFAMSPAIAGPHVLRPTVASAAALPRPTLSASRPTIATRITPDVSTPRQPTLGSFDRTGGRTLDPLPGQGAHNHHILVSPVIDHRVRPDLSGHRRILTPTNGAGGDVDPTTSFDSSTFIMKVQPSVQD